ncbi:hypothetical protein FRC01_000912 [Tulasnella sp. 417]|nr:hypothetical protein FRC01_000912 [Tulasnella sp. 417]
MAEKRPRMEHPNSARLRTAALAAQNRHILPTPGSQLPTELITIILKLCFPKFLRWKDDMKDIYDIRLVSKLWKRLIEDTPWFWTNISTDYPTTVIQDCVRLSRNHLLEVEISSSWPYRGPKDLIEKLQLLQPHAERWETLTYHTREGSFGDSQHFRDFLESPAPNLQSLVARLTGTMSSPPPVLNMAGGKANQMKHLSLENILLPWSSQLLTGLETFSLSVEGTIPVGEIVNILNNSPGLWSFDLSYRSAGNQDIPTLPSSADSNTSHVTANSLQEVSVSFDDPRIASHILSRVSMPACRSLRMVVKPMTVMNDIHSLNVALSQFATKIGHAMSQCGRTTFSSWPEQPFQWTIFPPEDIFQFSLEFSYLPLDRFIECIRNLALASGSQLELEVELGPTPSWIADELGGWSEITKLNVASSSMINYDRGDEMVIFPDYLGQTRLNPGPGLSWPFPKLQEVDLSKLEIPLLRVFDMLNRRYLSSSDVQRMEELDIPVNTPSKLDIQVRGMLEWEDDVIAPAIESHLGVKSLEYGGNGHCPTRKLHQQPEDLPSRSQPTALDPLTATSTVLSAGSPNYHLPVELLTFILTLLFPDTDDRSKDDVAEIYRLRLVSKSWKELIEGTPRLWTYVSPKYPLVVVRDCLRWSKNHPLQISIVETWSYPMEALIDFLQLLQPQSHRWKTLSYANLGGRNLDRIRVRRFLESPAPMLQRLDVCLSEFVGEPWVNLAGGMTKRLKHLSLHTASLLECSDLLYDLETLGLDNVDIALRSFDLWNFAPNQSSATASAIPSLDLVANSLEEVIIQVLDPRIITLILSQVSMPSCKSLELSSHFAELGDNFLGRILDDALAQFIPRIREALNRGGVARFLVDVGPSDYQEDSSLQIEGFRFSFKWLDITTEGLIGWIRGLIAALDFPLELELILSTPDRPTIEKLREWNEFDVTKLRILLVGPEPDEMDEAVLALDFLGDVLVNHTGGLSWNFPNLRELDVSSAEYDFSRLFNMLNRRYLPDAYVRDMEELGISIQTPTRIDLRVGDVMDDRDATVRTAMERHWGIKSIKKGELDQ